MLWSTFLSWYYPDLLNHFEIALPKKNEVYLGFCITRLISDKVTISFVRERIPNDKVICNIKVKYSISVCITFTKPISSMYTFVSSCFTSNVSISVTTWNNYFFIWQFTDDSLQAIIKCILCGILQSCLRGIDR